ncbi:hypothetical protein GQX74_010154 [Glossina fuscipes]|nr:hypothetical protein GQX74_010154 [Glossina fuscipes]
MNSRTRTTTITTSPTNRVLPMQQRRYAQQNASLNGCLSVGTGKPFSKSNFDLNNKQHLRYLFYFEPIRAHVCTCRQRKGEARLTAFDNFKNEEFCLDGPTCSIDTKWIDISPLAPLGGRSSVNADAGYVPAELVYGATLQRAGQFVIQKTWANTG